MNSLLQKLGLTLNDVLKSTLTLLLFFVLLAVGPLWLFKNKIPPWAIGGYVVGVFYFLAVNTRNNGGSQGDTVFSGGLADIVNSGTTGDTGGALRDPNIYNNLGL